MMQLRKDIIIHNFNRFASKYESAAKLQLRVAKELISQCAGFSGTVLDLGAGPGIIAKNSDWEVISLDLAYQMCRMAKEQAVTADIEQLPFSDSFFTNVISSLSLQWVNDFAAALAEINRVLKPGGKFAFTAFSPNSLKDLAAAFSYIDSDKHLMEFAPVIKIFAMLKKNGFDNLVMSSQRLTYNFPDIISALHSIKDIGASYGFSAHKGLRGRKYFKQLENIYKGICSSENTVPLNWEVLYIHAEKLT